MINTQLLEKKVALEHLWTKKYIEKGKYTTDMTLTIEFEEDKNQLTYLNLLDEIKRDFLHEK